MMLSYDCESNYVAFTVRGHYTTDEVATHFRMIRETLNLYACNRLLLDICNSSSDRHEQDLFDHYETNIRDVMLGRSVAIVHEHDQTTRVAVFISWLSNKWLNIRAFNDVSEARAWLVQETPTGVDEPQNISTGNLYPK